MTLTWNVWIIWLVVSFFGIVAISRKRLFVTTSIKTGELEDRQNLSMVAVRVIVAVATVLFAVLLAGGLLFTEFQVSKPIPELIARVALIILGVVAITAFYNVALRLLFNQARSERREELREEKERRKGGE